VFGDGTVAGSGNGAEDEFDRSLGDFDGAMKREQERIASAGGAAADAEEVLRQAGGGGAGAAAGGGGGEGEAGSAGGGEAATANGDGGEQQGGNSEVGQGGPEEPAAVTEGCSDQDKVARQLCEAATKEADPFLKAALWDEYNEYRKILARQ
jgi:hypothetical protein